MGDARKTTWLERFKTIFQTSPRTKKILIGSLAAAALLSLAYLGYSLVFLNKIHPNVTVGSINVGGMSKQQAKTTLLAAAKKNQDQPVSLQYQDQIYKIAPSDVTWQFDEGATVDEAYQLGRSGRFWQSLGAQLVSPFYHHLIKAVVTFNADQLNQKMAEIAQKIDKPAVDASAKYVNDKIVVTPEQAGTRLPLDELKLTLLDQWAHFQPSTIQLATKPDLPKVVAANSDELTAQAEALVAPSITLTWNDTKKVLTKKELKQLISFSGASPALSAGFGADKVKSLVVSLANDIDRPAKEPKLAIKSGVLAVVGNSQIGAVVDVPASTAAMLAVLNKKTDAIVPISIVAQAPLITENNLEPLGIKERIGVAQTSFVGSPVNRKANIANGVKILQSALIKPSEEFSTVKTLGAVNDATGFLPELVIKEDRTVPEFGGGLCQVSTTLFRAVMNAGLKITDRQNHTYRVGYYEPPVGMDATIYLPKPDFKFVNTTDHHILIQGQVVGNYVIFELWGTNDGRTINQTTPVVTNVTDPGPAIYANTDTLNIGETKQIEKAHQGATAVFTYTVTKGGQEINKQTFKSIYKPWPARFLVGTHDPNAPPPPTP